MRNVIPSLARCTIEHANGKFCDSPSMKDAPFPICPHHAIKLHKHMLEVYAAEILGPQPTDEERERTWTARGQRHKEALNQQSLVYYVRIHDFIKIGVTTKIKQRMQQLRVPTDAILATEPGGRDLEKDRHKQFADLRIGTLENFKPTKRLIEHIDAVRDFHGEPNITGYLPSYI